MSLLLTLRSSAVSGGGIVVVGVNSAIGFDALTRPTSDPTHTLVMVASTNNTSEVLTPPAGWVTELADVTTSRNGIYVFTAPADVASIAFTGNTQNRHLYGLSGVNAADVVIETAIDATNPDDGKVVPPSITVDSGNLIIVGALTVQSSGSPNDYPNFSPYSVGANTVNSSFRLATSYYLQPTTGSSPSGFFQGGGFTIQKGFTLEIKAASVATGGSAAGSYSSAFTNANAQANTFTATSSIRNAIAATYTATSSVLNTGNGSYSGASSIDGMMGAFGSYSASSTVANSQTTAYSSTNSIRNAQASSYTGASTVLNSSSATFTANDSVLNSAAGAFNSANTVLNGASNAYSGSFSTRNTQQSSLSPSYTALNTQTGSFTGISSIEGANTAFGNYSASSTIVNSAAGAIAFNSTVQAANAQGSYASQFSVLNGAGGNLTVNYTIGDAAVQVITSARASFNYRGGYTARRSSGPSSFVPFLPDDFMEQEAEIPRIKLTPPDRSAEIIQSYLDDVEVKKKRQAKGEKQRKNSIDKQERAVNALAKRLAQEAIRLAALAQAEAEAAALQQQEEEMILQFMFAML